MILVLAAGASSAGCGGDGGGLAGPPHDGGGVTAHDGGGSTTPDGGGGGDTGLPCDVQAVLTNHCTSCHAATPVASAPMPLVTYEDLARASLTQPSLSNAALSVMRMHDTARPMPPSPFTAVPAADIATFENWVNAGMQRGTCGGPVTVCTSGTYWTRRDRGSELMHPGMACIDCHSLGEGPDVPLTIGGTVYPTSHEPDDCNGSSEALAGGTVTVTITGSDGASVQLTTNEAGNFMYDQPIAFPITATVEVGGRVRAMTTPATSGDCNSCHTESGTSGAPGRIQAP
ncbi:MAG: hypothetical protein U0234_14245 [Sandaracinus sp.]